jgi:deazaflavin-dependent oxidoreductase (nitroreductase family)
MDEVEKNMGTAPLQNGPARTAPDAEGSERLSLKERVALFLHRESDKRLTPLGIWVMRRTKGGIVYGRFVRMLGAPKELHVLLLTTRGRRSGKERTVVLQYFPDGDAMIIVAANDGGASHPGWYFNLKGDDSARVEVMGRTIGVRAEQLPAEAAADWWQRILRGDPSYARYQRATKRTFPILRLVPEEGQP